MADHTERETNQIYCSVTKCTDTSQTELHVSLNTLTLWPLLSLPVIVPAYASALLHYTEYSCYVAAVVRWFDGQLHYTQDILRRPSHTQHTI